MEKSERDDLEALARDAGAERWCLHPNGTSVWTGDEYDSEGGKIQQWVCAASRRAISERDYHRMSFIAAANPAALLELLGGYGISETHPDAGEDGEEVCNVCGYIAPHGHTHTTCFNRGKDTGAIDENIRCAELLCEVLGVEYEGESFAIAGERVAQLLRDARQLLRDHPDTRDQVWDQGFGSDQIHAVAERLLR